MGERLKDIFLQLFCEKNSDGSKKLRLKGKDLNQRIGLRVNSEDVTKIVKFLNNHPEVNDVKLCHNEIGDEGLKILCDDILNQPNSLESLNVMSCDITDIGVRHIFETSILGFIQLKVLRLGGNKLGPLGAYLLALMLPNCTALEYLDIGDCDLTVDSIDDFLINAGRSSLKVLNIGRIVPVSCRYQYDPKIVAESTSEFFRLSKNITEFHAQKCGFDGHDVEIMIAGLNHNQTLKFLDLGYNNLGDFGGELLAEWLRTRPALLALNVAGNKMRNHAARALSLMIPFSKLRLLDISYNYISTNGMVDILNSIKKPYMLRYFFCWGNSLGHKANVLIQRMVESTVFQQECIDVKVYRVDGILYAARYPADHYKHRYYEVMDHGCAVELKIKKNRIENEGDEPRALVNFEHVDRYPILMNDANKLALGNEITQL